MNVYTKLISHQVATLNYVTIIYPLTCFIVTRSGNNGNDVATRTTNIRAQAEGPLTSHSKEFAAYNSPYSGSFNLIDTMYIPRPCATSSVNLTQMDYFYGQYSVNYNLKWENRDVIMARMNDERELVFQNGTDAENFAWLGSSSNSRSRVYVQSNDESLVGTQRLMIRGCDEVNNLHEINLYVNVSSNSAPEFVEDIQT